ncbi:P-loop containing nucleoside triphosphate hydrolase protein [Stipitochalara longipes BDJ]|nr:P-loop containing nucleoside triphosphate hydrolase protein [Stipitochalara longipes BDJ]
MTPASRGWNPYPTPISLQTPLNPWSSGTSLALQSSNNPFVNPRYADAEGLQAVASNLGTGLGSGGLEVRGDAYVVSSPANTGSRNPLPYPVTPEMRNSQPALRWGAPWATVLQTAFPNDSQAYLGNFPVQPPSEPAVVGGSDSSSSSNDEILIAVFGMTGTGKTTFIEKVSGQRLNIGHNLHSCTMNIEKIHCKIGKHNVTLVDTPGFDDTSRSDTDVLILIANWLRDSYKERTLLSGIIYLHRISDPRMSGSSIKNLRMFRKLCGAESMHNVSLVTTMWDRVTRIEGETRERDLINGENGFWKTMIGSGCLVRRHDGSVDSARGLVAELAGMERTVLRLQKEIAEGKKLIETEAGLSLNEELLRVRRQHEEELRCVKEEMAAAMKSGLFPSSSS